jgi:hypothetical protein
MGYVPPRRPRKATPPSDTDAQTIAGDMAPEQAKKFLEQDREIKACKGPSTSAT